MLTSDTIWQKPRRWEINLERQHRAKWGEMIVNVKATGSLPRVFEQKSDMIEVI